MSDSKDRNSFKELPPSEKIQILLEEREKCKISDPNLYEQLNLELIQAVEEEQYEYQVYCDNLNADGYEISPSSIFEEIEVIRKETSQPAKEEDSLNTHMQNNAAKQVGEIHKALLGSITPKEQTNNEIIEQMKAKKLAQGAIKLRNRN